MASTIALKPTPAPVRAYTLALTQLVDVGATPETTVQGDAVRHVAT